ncbi:GFA family protein [Methylocystis rosea]|uniref:GFA family protein n=1 Tax=Methylocystis rosea TaxID=173366 RepID=A0ABX6EJX0_9HYPH|nr:GFA family protein [Methylocystis rosea]QGM94162.1 GFA family protein [Methylocystis rosea]
MQGGCHCGAVRYSIEGEAITSTLCHCADCRRHAGAPVVGWAMFPDTSVSIIKGATTTYESSEHGRRQFCPACGTGLFYRNSQVLPGVVDVQTATLDDPSLLPPRAQIQIAERIAWMKEAHALPEFERYPPMQE